MSRKDLTITITTDSKGEPSTVRFHPKNDPNRTAFEIRVTDGTTIEVRAVDMIKASDKNGEDQIYNSSLSVRPETSNSIRVSLNLYDQVRLPDLSDPEETVYDRVMENTFDFSLMFTEDGTLVDGETYPSLDRARDIAFEVSLETDMEVAICRHFGSFENIVETVQA